MRLRSLLTSAALGAAMLVASAQPAMATPNFDPCYSDAGILQLDAAINRAADNDRNLSAAIDRVRNDFAGRGLYSSGDRIQVEIATTTDYGYAVTCAPVAVFKVRAVLRASRTIQVFGGTPVTLTASVGGVVPGTVTFRAGSSVLGRTTMSHGTAKLTLPASLALGRHSIVATYTPGSDYYLPSTSTPAVINVVRSVTDQGTTSGHRYKGGNRAAGAVSYTAGIQIHRTAGGAIDNVRAVGRITKMSKATSVQVDRVTLGNSTAAIVIKNAPTNSRTGASALSTTTWKAVPATSCTNYRAAVHFSIRWTNGTTSKFTVQSPLSRVCGPAGH